MTLDGGSSGSAAINVQPEIKSGATLFGSHTFSGNLILKDDAEINIGKFQTLTLSGDITSTTSTQLTKGGAGGLILKGNNTFTRLDLEAGMLEVNSDSSFGAVPATLDPSNIFIRTGNSLYDSSFPSIKFDSSMIVNANRGISLSSSPGTGAFQQIIFDTGPNSVTIAGAISEAGSKTSSLVKQGAGSLTLSGANSYAASTIVTAGNVIVANVSGLGTGSLAISAGAKTILTPSLPKGVVITGLSRWTLPASSIWRTTR